MEGLHFLPSPPHLLHPASTGFFIFTFTCFNRGVGFDQWRFETSEHTSAKLKNPTIITEFQCSLHSGAQYKYNSFYNSVRCLQLFKQRFSPATPPFPQPNLTPSAVNFPKVHPKRLLVLTTYRPPRKRL